MFTLPEGGLKARNVAADKRGIVDLVLFVCIVYVNIVLQLSEVGF